MTYNQMTYNQVEIDSLLVSAVASELLHQKYSNLLVQLQEEAKELIDRNQFSPSLKRQILADKVRSPQVSILELMDIVNPMEGGIDCEITP